MSYDYDIYKKGLTAMLEVAEAEEGTLSASDIKLATEFEKQFSKNYYDIMQAILSDCAVIPEHKIRNASGRLSASLWLKELTSGDYKFPHAKDDVELIILTLKALCAASPKGGSRHVTFSPLINRSILVKYQARADGIEYSTGVPVVPYIYKKIHNLPYSSWDFADPNFKKIIGSQLAECLDAVGEGSENLEDSFTEQQLKEFYEVSMYANGATHNVKLVPLGLAGARQFNALPKLLRLMLLQKWVFAPEVTNKYVVRNIYEWDNDPHFNVCDDIIAKLTAKKSKPKKFVSSDNEPTPW